jgi:hypothetical protein
MVLDPYIFASFRAVHPYARQPTPRQVPWRDEEVFLLELPVLQCRFGLQIRRIPHESAAAKILPVHANDNSKKPAD